MLAKTHDCDVLAFSRDIDGDSDYNRNRKRDIESGILRASKEYPSIKIIGGCAMPCMKAGFSPFPALKELKAFPNKEPANACLTKTSHPKIPHKWLIVSVSIIEPMSPKTLNVSING
jgi:hypothetical protein